MPLFIPKLHPFVYSLLQDDMYFPQDFAFPLWQYLDIVILKEIWTSFRKLFFWNIWRVIYFWTVLKRGILYGINLMIFIVGVFSLSKIKPMASVSGQTSGCCITPSGYRQHRVVTNGVQPLNLSQVCKMILPPISCCSVHIVAVSSAV